jgi:hypothetical protein
MGSCNALSKADIPPAGPAGTNYRPPALLRVKRHSAEGSLMSLPSGEKPGRPVVPWL